MSDPFPIKQNDTAPPIRTNLTDEDQGFSLSSGIASVRFVMRALGAGVAKISAVAQIVTAADGIIQYDWQEGDTDTPGQYHVEWKVIFQNGKRATFPNKGYDIVDIEEELDT
jgi:hypothetical protein